MRRFVIVGLIALLAASIAPPIGASAAPAQLPMIVQSQSGTAGGTVNFSLTGTQSHAGRYDVSGQLGHGTYTMSFGSPDTECVKNGDSTSAHGTAKFVRSDGATLSGTVELSAICRQSAAPETLVVELTRGSRDLEAALLTFSGTLAGTYATPSFSLGVESFVVTGATSVSQRIGYWTLSAGGVVHAFGGAEALGNAISAGAYTFSHIERTPSGNGYWLADTGGEVFAFGDARSYGNAPRRLLFGAVVTSLSSTPSGHGYWLFTSRGLALPFGDAKFYGDMRNTTLNGEVIGSIATPTGHGYYMVALDGGVFTFGDAKFRGSMGGTHLNQPVVGLVPNASNTGYWLVASDGGIFAFNAPFLGSMGGTRLARPVIGMVRYGSGYMMVAQDGGIFDFSKQPFFGSLGGSRFTDFTISAASIG